MIVLQTQFSEVLLDETAFHEFSAMLTAMSLPSSLCELWLVQVSRLPLFLPEYLASPAHLALQEIHQAFLLLSFSLASSNAQMVCQNQVTFLSSGMSEVSPF